MKPHLTQKFWRRLALLVGLLSLLPQSPPHTQAAGPIHLLHLPLISHNFRAFNGPQVPFGYGWIVFDYTAHRPGGKYAPTSFNWIQVTQNPPSEELCDHHRLPYNVLLRLNKTEANIPTQEIADDAHGWAQNLKRAERNCVEAFAIGNETNLAGAGAYNGPINAAAYADQLCAAYHAIKAVDPNYIVVSAGLAPTGDIYDPNLAVDEEIYARQMLDQIAITQGRADACFDVFGYHNYGFRTGVTTSPDDAACPSGMCYRGVERIYTLLRAFGVNKRIWTTEFGWLRDYRAECSSAIWNVFFAGFEVADQQQADHLVEAFAYARQNWPWMGAMFLFNLDFHKRPWWESDHCYDEQGWFAVQGYPAEQALEQMFKP